MSSEKLDIALSYILSTIAIPGLILHESSHILMCFILKVRVDEFNPIYFVKNSGFHGGVRRAAVGSLATSMLIAFAPSIFILPIIFELVALANILQSFGFAALVMLFLCSVCLEDFPSRGDLEGELLNLSEREHIVIRWWFTFFVVFQLGYFFVLLGPLLLA